MDKGAISDVAARRGSPLPGPLYPHRCLECAALLRETYGGVGYLRCSDCVAADLEGADPARRDRRPG